MRVSSTTRFTICAFGLAPSHTNLPKCSTLGAIGKVAAGLSLASEFTGTGYILGVSWSLLVGLAVGVELAGSVALVSDMAGNVGIAVSGSVTPSIGFRGHTVGVIVGGIDLL